MNCEFCHTKLNPYMLKQASRLNNELVFEIECIDCRKYNYVSEELYFHIKSDHFIPRIQPINNKLPSEMNIIFVSMERAGISWIIKTLSQYHEKMFGTPIKFTKDNAEISQQIATKERFSLPKGWNNVYSIDPQLLLDRVDPDGNKYDRVVVVHRKLETFKNVYKIKMARENLNNEFINKIIEKTESEYKMVYKEIKDPRLMQIDLWDLNQYTEACFNKLMDFLNFPQHNRPPVVRTATLPFEALFEAYSSVWDKDFKLTGMLGRVEGMFQLTNDGILEYIAKHLMEKNMNDIILKNVLIIGPGFHVGCHFSENMYYAFKEKGYNVELLDLVKLGWGSKECQHFQKKEELYPLSKALSYTTMRPDLVLFDEPAWDFGNDMRIPVFYSHRDYTRNPTIFHPDIAFFWHQGVINHFRHVWGFPHWSARVSKMITMNIASDFRKFKPLEKRTYHGVLCLAGRETMKNCFEVHEQKANEHLTNSLREIKEFIELKLQWIEDPIGGLTDERFRELLPQCESLWICFPLGQYVSRRILEAMACKVVCIIKLENKEHEEVLRNMGFEPNVHYIKIEKISDMIGLNKTWDFNKYKDMTEKAYQIVTTKHTFLNRVDEIDELYKLFILQQKVTVG